MSLTRLKLSTWYWTKNGIRIKHPYPWHLACVQTTPLPSVRIGEGVYTQAIDTQPSPPPHHQEKMLMNSRLQWCIYGYSFTINKQHNVSFTNINVIEAQLPEEMSRWQLEITLLRGHVAAARKRGHQWYISLTPNNTKTMGRMTCHCFQWPIRRDLTSSSYTTALKCWLSRSVNYM